MNRASQPPEDVGRKRIVFVSASYLFVHKVLRDMVRRCPQATLLHFTNPMSALTGAKVEDQLLAVTEEGTELQQDIDRILGASPRPVWHCAAAGES